MDPENLTASSHLKNKTGPKREFMSNGFSGALAANFREGIPCFQTLNFSCEKARRISFPVGDDLNDFNAFDLAQGWSNNTKQKHHQQKAVEFFDFQTHPKKHHSTRVVYIH